MKISNLPQATSVNDDDVVPVVQGGKTKKLPRGVLKIPEGITLRDNTLYLSHDGDIIGVGAEIPIVSTDDTVVKSSTNPVQGGAVYTALQNVYESIDGSEWTTNVKINSRTTAYFYLEDFVLGSIDQTTGEILSTPKTHLISKKLSPRCGGIGGYIVVTKDDVVCDAVVYVSDDEIVIAQNITSGDGKKHEFAFENPTRLIFSIEGTSDIDNETDLQHIYDNASMSTSVAVMFNNIEIDVDEGMSEISENPVQNKVAKAYVDEQVKDLSLYLASANLCDNVWEYGYINDSGVNVADENGYRTKNYLSVKGGETIYQTNPSSGSLKIVEYGENKNLVKSSTTFGHANKSSGGELYNGYTLNSSTRYIRIWAYPGTKPNLSTIKINVLYYDDANENIPYKNAPFDYVFPFLYSKDILEENKKNVDDLRSEISRQIEEGDKDVKDYVDLKISQLDLSGGGSTNVDDTIENYVKTEADNVIERVIESQGNRTFTFACITDMHYGSYGYYAGVTDYPDGVKHACQALKYIDERIKLDAVAVLGDYTDGMASTQYGTAIHDFKGVNAVLDKLRFAPNLRLQGNHDFIAEHSPIAYRYIGAYSEENVEWGNFLGGYFYKDFSTYKLRIICLNTTEQNNTSVSPSTEQYQWFINSLDLSSKENASKWQILILSHIPLDFWTNCGNYKFAFILNAYKTNGTWTDGNEISCDFSTGNNVATLIGNIHGHTHNFKVDKLYLGNIEASGTPQSTVYRMATPNSCFGAENKNYTGYTEDTVYTKTENSATDTAFCVYCIDLDTYTINAICYGAGYDRKLNYASGTIAETYSISNVLTNVTNSNTAKNVNVDASYSAELTTSGTITSVTITMGGVDITSTAYSNGTIYIAEVTGNVVITAIAEVESPEEPEEPEELINQILVSTDINGNIYNGKGYKENTRYSTSQETEVTSEGSYLTGYIPIKNGQTVYLKNLDFTDAGGNTVTYFTSDKTYATRRDNGAVKDPVYESGVITQFTTEDYQYMRICCSGIDETSIITINEKIE